MESMCNPLDAKKCQALKFSARCNPCPKTCSIPRRRRVLIKMRRPDFMQRKFGLTPDAHFVLVVGSALLFVVYFWLGVRRVTSQVALSAVRVHDELDGVRGWLFKYEDRSDFQWYGFREYIGFSIALISVHVFLGHIVSLVSRKSPSVCAFYQAIFGIASIIYLHGPASIVTFVLVALFSLVSQLCRYRRTIHAVPYLTWALALLVLALNSFDGPFNALLQLIDNAGLKSPVLQFLSSGKVIYPVQRSINLLILRLVSFNMDRFWAERPPSTSYTSQMVMQTSKQPDEPMSKPLCVSTVAQSRCLEDYNLLFLLSYTFFLPLYIAGPVIPFNAFCHSLSSKASPRRKWLLKAGFKWILFYALTEFVATRMLLSSALAVERSNHQYWSLFHTSELLILMGIVLCYTWLKFSVLWDGFRIWSIFVGVYCPANLLCFVFDHYSVQHFWKTWHASFHLWIIRYLYVPLGGSKHKITCSLLIFLFVALWHRINLDFVLWALITVATILFELHLESTGKHSLSRKVFRVNNGHQYFGLIAGTEFINLLLIIANLVGFGCGGIGILRVMREFAQRPMEGLTSILFFAMFGFIHTSYLIERDANALATRVVAPNHAHSS
eukprot:Gregarina_sp_Pseudo_9__1618@NODE_208_length_3611_cov_31_945969_g193_i0_p1_GENE_NODE_208_length_3611_cov_31_945969_g193_i0NODE_208_length_3611_cov_31_945969_g193_i0_p1_ORF_typecomplete_len611_score78_50MBOAT/PF03062_19/1e27Oxidored_q5_N/PF01059_17/2_1e02Oxidored_q5_N/PF01059_17/2_8_NODE_208_length_3611_cov_31_945969_g193_i08092641